MALLARIDPVARLHDLPSDGYRTLTVGLNMLDGLDGPGMFLDKALLRQLADFGIELDISTYCYIAPRDE